MKSLFVALLAVLALSSWADAGVFISVDGVADPADSQVFAAPSDLFSIGLWGDGQTEPMGFVLGVAAGDAASLDIESAQIVYPGNMTWIRWETDPDIGALLGIHDTFIQFELNDLPLPPTPKIPLDGVLVSDIMFHCEDLYGATLLLYGIYGDLADIEEVEPLHMKVFTVPEPTSIVLFALGGCLLRRRK